jgi:hypothetical protein
VAQAPEPSLILWEHLPFNALDRWRRKITTTFLAGSLVGVSIVIAFLARYYQSQNRSTDTTCPADWASLNSLDRQQMAKADNRYLGCYCNGKDFITQVKDDVCKVRG